MKKRLISLLLTIVFCIGLLPVGAGATNNNGWDASITWVDKFDSDGKLTSDTRTWGANYFRSDSDSSVTWNSISYVIPKDTHVTINGDLTAGGGTWLYLCDNATLTVTGSLNLSDNDFFIYGQTSTHKGNDAGKLIVRNSINSGAAVRGGANADQLYIYGGRLELHGGTDRSIVNGIMLENKYHLLKGTLDDNSVKYSAWAGQSILTGNTLLLEYCKHKNTTCTSIDDTQHREICSDCGFEWPAENHNTNIVAYNDFNDTCHKLACSDCGAVSSTATAEHTLVTAPTDDGKGHTTRCRYCGYTSGTPAEHTYENGECSECGFVPVAFSGSAENPDALYDSLQTAFETVKDGGTITLTTDITPSENITFGEYENDDGDWVKNDKSATLVMAGHTLNASTGTPALEVAGGTLTIADDATLEGRESLSSEIPSSPAIKVTGGNLIFKGNLTATGGSGSSNAAPAIEVAGGKVTFEGKVTATGGLQGTTLNTMTCKPAVYATSGELDFKGDLDLNGGLTITGDATLTNKLSQGTFRVEYAKEDGTKETVIGPRVSVEGSSEYKNLYSLLAEDYGFAGKDDANKTVLPNVMADSQKSWSGTDLTIVTHKHTWAPGSGDLYQCTECQRACDHPGGFRSGKCTVCGKPCSHYDAAQSSKDYLYYCGICGQQMFVQNTKGTQGTPGFSWAFFTNLTDAMAAAEDGWTMKLLDNVPVDYRGIDIYEKDGGTQTITLDLNGKNITGDGGITVGKLSRYPQPDIISPTTLNIVGRGSILLDYALGVDRKSTLNLEGWTGGTINIITVGKNTDDNVVNEATFKVGENAGTINKLEFTNWVTDGAANTTLSGGTYGKIEVQSFGGKVILGDLLAPGYACKNNDGPMPYNTKFSNSADESGGITDLTVVRCTTHEDTDSDDHCDYCNTDLTTNIVATVETGGKTYHYTDLSAAIAKANTTGGTIHLLRDVENLNQALTLGDISNEKDNNITLDLNGKTLSGTGGDATSFLTVETSGTVTISGTGLIKNTKPGANYAVYVSAGTLTIEGGTFKGPDDPQAELTQGYALGVGPDATLNIKGGRFNSEVYINDRSQTTIRGGVFASLRTFADSGVGKASSIGSLLADGYGFQKADTLKWLTETERAGTTATLVAAVQAPIHSVELKANKTSVEYGKSGEVKLGFSYERSGGSDMSKMVTTTWYQVKDGVPKELYNTSVSYTLPAKLEAGEYTYRITIKDNDSGYTVSSNDITITVTQIDLSKAELTFTQVKDTNGYMGNIQPDKGTFVVLPFGGFTDKLSPLTYYFTVSHNGVTLKEGTDYKIVSGNEQKNAGTHEIKIEGLGNYTGTATTTWEIKPYTLSANSGNVSISPIIKTYDGTTAFTLPEDFSLAVLEDVDMRNKVNPVLGFSGVTSCEIQLTKGTDYTISDITFDSAEAGDRTATFTITLTTDNFVFEGNKKELKVTLNASGGINVCIDKADVEMTEDAKTVTQEITNDLAYTYTIDLPKLPELKSPKTYGDITYSLPVVQIDTDYYKPGNAEVKDGKLILSIDKNPVTTTGSIGSVKVTVSSTNYKDVTFTVNLEAVNKQKPNAVVSVATDNIVYGITLADIKLKVERATVDGVEIPGTIAWDKPDTMPNAGAQTYGWTFTPNDTAHYCTVSDTIDFFVDKATPTGEPKYTAITSSGKTLADAALTVNESWPKGTFRWVDKDGKALADTTEVKANTAYQWKFMPESRNYNPIEGSITLYSVSTGGGSSSGSSSSNTVSAPSKSDNGSVSTDKSTAKKGDTVTITVKPDAGYTIGSVTVKDAKGNTITVTNKGNGKFTFVMPDTKVTITPNFVAEQPAGTGYADVASSAWYSDAIRYVTDKGLMNGTGSDKFSPSGLTTRGMIMTILARNSGVDTNGGSAWYEKGMNWAKANGVSDGTKPNADITREQLVVMLYRYAGSPKASGSLSDFSDSASVSSYAVNAMQWAVANGIVNGANGKLNPKNNATRAEVAAILMRFCEMSK